VLAERTNEEALRGNRLSIVIIEANNRVIRRQVKHKGSLYRSYKGLGQSLDEPHKFTHYIPLNYNYFLGSNVTVNKRMRSVY
jgi:hypothetical protein